MTASPIAAEPTTIDVAIIGMGPVGKMAALMLARRGHSVLISERKQLNYALPRAVAHDAEVARILQSVGLPPDSIPDAIEPYDDLYVWVNGNDDVLLEVDWRGIDPSGWHNTYFYNQPGLEAHLDNSVALHPELVTVRRGTEIAISSQDDDGADLTLTDLTTGATELLRAKYVLGADGANSETRRSLGIGWHDLGYFYDWLVIDVVPGPSLHISPLAKQVCDPVRPTTIVPAGPGRRRWEFMRLEGERSEDLVRPERIWQLLEPFGVTPETASVERGVVYTFNSGWAASWRSGRVLLVGDAAHLMPPFAGQGLAAGFRDCINLMWKLDLVLRGVSPDSLLDTYESERTNHVADFIAFSMSLGRVICITDPDAAHERDVAMVAARASREAPEPPPAPRLGAGVHESEAGGYLAWQGQIARTPRERLRFDNAFGSGALILNDAALVDGIPVLDSLRELGITVATFGNSTRSDVQEFNDLDGTYADWFNKLGTAAVLVRPDFYVFGTADDPSSVAALVVRYEETVRTIVARER
ncbi:MAG TPA: bifunctional 3-(3-hydroxy-phenyl)propionate/3-hydroxycinnamic acid hydroxylase [Galbitalea sp.]|jgi:3-(3-hydroxy-phenyl)propionate hydroxylase|nr:bifunctional 3-(3-hydroxy-phenyl)propionate/3-hydroxycinnamic acid hydroxylase [Galbitalea sp.]